MAKWKPSKTRAREFAKLMTDIDDFCITNNIQQSRTSDSYYFTINEQKYRVSNHSIESSNARAYNYKGEKVRETYHDSERKDDTIYIHASKTRIIEIYNNLKNGYALDGNGYIKL